MDSRKITDPLNRGMVGGMLGMPADMLNMLRNGGRSVGNLANRLAGVNAPPAPMVENPVYGQEWWGNKMQKAGYVSPNRNKLAEFGAGLLDPGSVMTDVPMLAKGLFALGDPALQTVTKGLLAKRAYDVAPDVARAAAKNLSAPATLNKPGFAGQRGAIVWHGSPHAFDAFDASKIGTGEGAQAYGHGLYLAESPSVAKTYADTLGEEVLVKGKHVYKAHNNTLAGDSPLGNGARTALQGANWDLAKAQEAMKDAFQASKDPYFKRAFDELSALSPADITRKSGSLYKVDLPDDAIAKMLDWDKPLSQQAPEVQAWVKDPYNAYRSKLVAADVGGNEPTGNLIFNRLQELMNEGKRADVFTNQANYGAANASRELKDYGIPGIRYLDGGSRGTGAGTSNFVVFPGNEGLLKILERNGKPLK